ncbi:MAG: S41 family peptidase [Thermoanaerobaculum sp.]|nr:S41 family peptidase [Thermoanaerobaculum sp.]
MGRLGFSLVAMAAVGGGALTGALLGGNPPQSDQLEAFLNRYVAVLQTVQELAPTEFTPQELVYGSVDGMLETLDPHSNFLRPEAFAAMRERQQGSFFGIGVLIGIRGGKVTIITPIQGTPAYRLGLRAGDIIDAVDGQPTADMDLDEVARRLRGPEGTTVKVTITRPGLPEPLEFTVTRARVPTDSVRYAFLLDERTAYIRVGEFTRTTGNEVAQALQSLIKQGASRLVLDLRDNPGGLVDSAVEVAGLLLQPGQRVFSTRGRTADSFQDYRAPRDGLHFEGPVVVVVNSSTASAAEIVAGAIQDHDRGLVVGEPTFGKGVVQTIFPVKNSGVALTTAKYYTPSGRCIQRDWDSFFSYVHHNGAQDPGPSPPAPPSGEVYFTDSGRKVYGGGGIFPDRVRKLGNYGSITSKLLAQAAFFQYAVQYLAPHADKEVAARQFRPNDQALAAFGQVAVEKGWISGEEWATALAKPEEKQDLSLLLWSEIVNVGLSLSEGYKVLVQDDEQIMEALSALDEAARLYQRVQGSTQQVARIPAKTGF